MLQARMNIIVNVHFGDRLAEVTVVGDVGLDKYLTYMENCRKMMKPDWVQILDLSESETQLSHKDMNILAHRSKEIAEQYPITGTILVTSNPVGLGLLDFYKTFAKEANMKQGIKVVETRVQAYEEFKKIRKGESLD